MCLHIWIKILQTIFIGVLTIQCNYSAVHISSRNLTFLFLCSVILYRHLYVWLVLWKKILCCCRYRGNRDDDASDVQYHYDKSVESTQIPKGLHHIRDIRDIRNAEISYPRLIPRAHASANNFPNDPESPRCDMVTFRSNVNNSIQYTEKNQAVLDSVLLAKQHWWQIYMWCVTNNIMLKIKTYINVFCLFAVWGFSV